MGNDIACIPGFAEPISSMTHLFGAGIFAILGYPLLRRGWGDRDRVAYLSVYIFSCVFLMSMSGVYHLLDRGGAGRAVLERLDHGAIFIFIAGTFTPALGILFHGSWRWVSLLILWTFAAAAVSLKTIFFTDLSEWFGLVMYLGMGWAGMIFGTILGMRYGWRFIRPLTYGGIAYTVGALLDIARWPVVIPGVLASHELFHVAVLVGAAYHWYFVFQFASGSVPKWAQSRERRSMPTRADNVNTLRIGLAQCRQSASLAENDATIFHFLDQAAEAGVKIVCFPQAQTVGYRVDFTEPDTAVPPGYLHDLHARIAKRCGEAGMACILGTETECDGKPYNSALVIGPTGNIIGVHHKTKLTPLDALAYSPGNSLQTFELFGIKVGIVICVEGSRFAETTREYVRQGAQLVFHPQNSMARPNDWKIPVQHAMIMTRAAENTIWFASCNICHETHQNCRSMVAAPDGLIWAQGELKREQLVIADIDI